MTWDGPGSELKLTGPAALIATRRGLGFVTDLLKPRTVAGDATVAVVSPASTPRAERVERGLEALRSLGYFPMASENILARGPLYFSGTQRCGSATCIMHLPTIEFERSFRRGAATAPIIFSTGWIWT